MSSVSSDSDSGQPQKNDLASRFLIVALVILAGFALYVVPAYVASFLIAIVAAIFGVSQSQLQIWADTTNAQFIFTLLIDAMVLGAIYFLLRLLQQNWRKIGVSWPRLRDVGYALVGFALYLVLYIVIAQLLQDKLDFEQRQELGFDTQVYGASLALVFLSLVVMPPIVEEILFRGFLYTQLKRALSVIWAGLVISLLFAAAHLQVGSGNPLLWVAALDTFVLSLVLVYLREKTGSIWAGVGVHAMKNFGAFLVLFVFHVS